MPPESSSDRESPDPRLIGAPRHPDGSILITPYDPKWPAKYAELAKMVRASLFERVLKLEHVGSTAVEGLSAKPVIDMLLVVEDTTQEPKYVPALEAQGFVFWRREPDWFEHRLLKHEAIQSNLHVFSAGCPEIDRMLAFRDRLRTNEAECRLYESTKVELAARRWSRVQDYADAKTDVVQAILGRALT